MESTQTTMRKFATPVAIPVTHTHSHANNPSIPTTHLRSFDFILTLFYNSFTLSRYAPHIPDPSDIDPSLIQQIQTALLPTARKTLRRHSQIDIS